MSQSLNELALAPATKQVELIASRAISVAELAEAHIAQIERLNPRLNAIVDFDADRVRALARLLDETQETRGPLHGLPVTIKSSIATAGYRCEIGSLIRKGDIPQEDALLVARLRAAGALILGTTNCPEFLMAYETANLLHGRTSNPWDLDRSPGGSSGGESAAIAAGMSAAGLGIRQRRLRPRARALHRHLLAQAHARPRSRARPSAALRRPVLRSGRHRPYGAHHRGCHASLLHAQRPGSA